MGGKSFSDDAEATESLFGVSGGGLLFRTDRLRTGGSLSSTFFTRMPAASRTRCLSSSRASCSFLLSSSVYLSEPTLSTSESDSKERYSSLLESSSELSSRSMCSGSRSYMYETELRDSLNSGAKSTMGFVDPGSDPVISDQGSLRQWT